MKFSFHKGFLLCITLFFTLILFNNLYFRKSKKIYVTDNPIKYWRQFDLVYKSVQNEKYILQWTSDKTVPFKDMGKGNSGFVKRKCKYVNCFVTSDKELLGDYKYFDVIAFAGPQLLQNNLNLPERRSPHQKYVFASIESSENYPFCNSYFNGYFNWTWTYRLDSEIQWGYIVIRDEKNNVIGPKKEMNWLKLEEMQPVSDELKKKLRKKEFAAAWFVSNCNAKNRRERIFSKLQKQLYKMNLEIDIFGKCGVLRCSNDDNKCDEMIAEKYYFYLAFENSCSEDYVTEKLYRALQNDAVPIVYGCANYTRFMPDGIYLDASKMSARKLAEKMYELINDPEEYANYFKWKNHYSYHKTSDSAETSEYCKMCELLNNKRAVDKTTIYSDFKKWWNPKNFSCDDDSDNTA